MPSVPTVKVVLAALVMVGAFVTGALPCTVRVKIWTVSGYEPFVPVMVRKSIPPDPAAGVPLKVAVPLLLGTNVTPPGKLPMKLRVVFG